MTIPEPVAAILRLAAPTLLTALGGPLGPMAAALATAALRQWLPASSAAAALPDGNPPRPATQGDIIRAVEQNRAEPNLVLDLKKAENDLIRLEQDFEFRFAELEQRDRESARAAARDTGLARPQFFAGMAVVALAMLMLFGVITGCIMAITGRLALDPAQAQIAIAAFGLIGTVVGVFQGAAVQVLGYYFGSSAGSKDKTDRIGATMEELGARLGEAASARQLPASAPPPVVPPPPPAPVVVPVPAPSLAPVVDWKQGPFGGARWKVSPDGVLVEGEAAVARTVGDPITVRRVWAAHGDLIMAECARLRVPVEVAVMVVCTESGGRAAATLTEPDGRTSSGLFQVLTGTASEVLGRNVTVEDLKDPAVGAAAGIGYLAKQKHLTWFDPVLSAAAYNAGGLYEPRPQDKNRFRLRSTGDHLERAIRWYGDVCFVAKADGWFTKAVASGG